MLIYCFLCGGYAAVSIKNNVFDNQLLYSPDKGFHKCIVWFAIIRKREVDRVFLYFGSAYTVSPCIFMA